MCYKCDLMTKAEVAVMTRCEEALSEAVAGMFGALLVSTFIEGGYDLKDVRMMQAIMMVLKDQVVPPWLQYIYDWAYDDDDRRMGDEVARYVINDMAWPQAIEPVSDEKA